MSYSLYNPVMSLSLDLGKPSKRKSPDYSRVVGRLQIPKGTVIAFGKNIDPETWKNYESFENIPHDTYECVETPQGFWLRLVKE